MSGSGQFCPRCGESVPERTEPLPGEPRDREASLCDACYFADFELIDAPDRIEVAVCATCGAVRRGNSWRDVGASDYTDVAIDEVREALGVHLTARDVQWGVEPEQVDANTVRMHCHFSGVVRETPVEETVVVPVRISRGTCDRCGRAAGGYHNAIVQVRAEGRTPTDEERTRAVELAEAHVAEREADGDRDAFVTEVKETDGGVDLKLSTTGLGEGVATRIVRELGGEVESYPTLVTEDEDGEEVYRVTYAVRLPRFTPGDVVDPEDGDGPVLVRSASGNLKGVRLATGDRYEADYEAGTNPDARRLGSVADAVETTVVTVEDAHAVQVLDPETYEARTVPRPDYLDPETGTASVIKSVAGLHVLPPDAPDA
ncbi:MAG: 60S ribosomal export protein NMD3 [Haloferacaceae archaeon]